VRKALLPPEGRVAATVCERVLLKSRVPLPGIAFHLQAGVLFQEGALPQLGPSAGAGEEQPAELAREASAGNWGAVRVLVEDTPGPRGAHIPGATDATPSGGNRSSEDSTGKQLVFPGYSTGPGGKRLGPPFGDPRHIPPQSESQG